MDKMVDKTQQQKTTGCFCIFTCQFGQLAGEQTERSAYDNLLVNKRQYQLHFDSVYIGQ